MHIFSGKYKNRLLKSPQGIQTRPTSGRIREAFFSICQNYIEGARFLDLFAGSGAMGLEALSRGAAFTTFVDLSRESVQCLKENITHLKVESQTKVYLGDVFNLLENISKRGSQFDVIYADPPYLKNGIFDDKSIPYSLQVIHLVEKLKLLSPGGELFIEDSIDLLNNDLLKGSSPTKGWPNFELGLTHLKLKSQREMGKTLLKQFQLCSP